MSLRRSDWTAIVVVFLIVLALGSVGVSASGITQSTPSSTWNQFHADAAHDGYSSWDGPVTNHEVWNTSFGGASDGLVVANGELIAASSDKSQMNALSEENGSMINSFPGSGFYDSISNVYVVSEGSSVYYGVTGFGAGAQYERVTATPLDGQSALWTYYVTTSQASPKYGNFLLTYYQGDLIVAVSGNGTLSSLTASSGTPLWSPYRFKGSVDTIPTVGNDTVVVGFTNSNNLSALSASTGTFRWNFNASGMIAASPAFANGDFYFGTLNGQLYCISSSGKLVWMKSFDAPIESTPAIAFGLVVFGADDGNLYALNSTTGSAAWNYTAGSGEMISSPAIANNKIVYEGSTNDYIYAINATSGSLVWQKDLGQGITSSPVLDNSYLFVVDSAGAIYDFANPSTTTTVGSSGLISINSTITTTSTNTITSSSRSLTTIHDNFTMYTNMTTATPFSTPSGGIQLTSTLSLANLLLGFTGTFFVSSIVAYIDDKPRPAKVLFTACVIAFSAFLIVFYGT